MHDRRFDNNHTQQRRRSRSRSPDGDRYRDKERSGRFHGNNNNDSSFQSRYNSGGDGKDRDNRDGGFGGGNRRREEINPSKTVMIKGLPAHTTEPSETGECKGFAFIEFYSVDYAKYLMATYAGSCGDSRAPQLIIENRAVTLEYARDDDSRGGRSGGGGGPSGGEDAVHSSGGSSSRAGDRSDRQPKVDWICDKCSCQNFARRNECYRCSNARSETCANIPASNKLELFSDVMVATSTPNEFLCARGLSPYVTEEQVLEVFRQFAAVKSVLLVRDAATRISRGLALVEFYSPEHAGFAMQSVETGKISVDSSGAVLKVCFAKPSFVAAQITQLNQPILPPQVAGSANLQLNHMAAAALQAAQWSSGHNNNSNSNSGASTTLNSAASSTVAATAMMMMGNRNKPAWPPNFETQGGAYVFQSQSGYFYDPISEYYYCPKSKLYYHTGEGVYYSYDTTLDPPFRRFDPPVPSQALGPSPSEIGNEPTSTGANDASRKPVVMSLSKAKAKNASVITSVVTNVTHSSPAMSASSSSTTVISGLPQQAKKIQNNMAKWNVAQQEDDSAPIAASATATSVPAQTPAQGTAPTVPLAINTPAAAATASHACLLCRRGFTSSEQLLRHEKESKLHAENLQKQAALVSGMQEESSTLTTVQYRDRASERRAVQGDSIPPPNRGRSNSLSGSTEETAPRNRRLLVNYAGDGSHSASNGDSAATSTATAAPLFLDTENPGNQLLRKMGWSEGQGLGKEGTGIEDPIEVAGRHASNKTGVGNSNSSTPALVYGDRDAYKESLLRAARARYEQLPK